MTVEKYTPTSEAMILVSQAEDLRQTRPLLDAVRMRIDELRDRAESVTIRSDDMREDCAGLLCEIRGLRWVFQLIEEAKSRVQTIGG